MFNSDYEIRLATLAALGGDTSTTFDSVYSIDLEILRLTQGGGGGGLDYDQIKNLLASSGLTEIVFNDGDSSITLDYALVSQIGQGGGGDYICVESIDALSGITSPKDGMLAYVGGYITQEERMVISADFYGAEWFNADMDFGNDVTARFGFHDNGNNANVSNGRFKRNNDGWFWNVPQNRSELPADFVYNNGVQGSLVSNIDGAEYAEHNEYANTIWIAKYNNTFPTVTFETNGAVTVATSVTVETVSVHHQPKGCWRYYADANKWLGYDNIYMDELTNAELQTLLNEYVQYSKPFGVYWVVDNNGHRFYVKGNASQYSDQYSYDMLKFASVPTNDTSDAYKVWSRRYTRYTYNNGEWQNDVNNSIQIPSFDNIRDRLNGRIITEPENGNGLGYGGLYNAAVNGTFSGVTVSTTININSTADGNFQTIANIYNQRSGRYCEFRGSELGYVQAQLIEMVFSASTSADWNVVDYKNFWNDNKYETSVLALKIDDNGDDTYTVSFFMTNDNWNSEGWRTDHYKFRGNSETGYTWSATEHQTITVAPHLYTNIRSELANNSNVKMAHKLL